MRPYTEIESHLRSAREHAKRGEYTAALVYFEGALQEIDRSVTGPPGC